MELFARKEYESEFTQFLNAKKADDPGIAQRQAEGRALLWDKAPQNLDEGPRSGASAVKRKPYVFD